MSFTHKLGTYLVVINIEDVVSYVIELYVQSYASQTYYINQFYMGDVNYNSIYMDQLFAVLFSDSVHEILPHSVFPKYQSPDNFQSSFRFTS